MFNRQPPSFIIDYVPGNDGTNWIRYSFQCYKCKTLHVICLVNANGTFVLNPDDMMNWKSVCEIKTNIVKN